MYCTAAVFADLLIGSADLHLTCMHTTETDCCVQLRRSQRKPQKTVDSLEADGKWIDAAVLLQLIEDAKNEAVQALQQSDTVTVDLSRQLHDALLACTVFGYIPPLRLACIRSLLHFLYKGPCPEPGCRRPNCAGNRVCVLSTEPLKMSFSLPHHKNETAWGGRVIDFTLPDEFAQLLHIFLRLPHQRLRSFHNFAERDCPFVFMTASGKGFDNATFSKYWTTWLVAHDACPMPPSFCRHVFVGERRSNARVTGPSDEGASFVMGHSLAQWDKWYDMHFHSRIGQKAVDDMRSWRQALLQASPAEPAVGVETSAQATESVQCSGADAELAPADSQMELESDTVSGYETCGSVFSVESDIAITLDTDSDQD